MRVAARGVNGVLNKVEVAAGKIIISRGYGYSCLELISEARCLLFTCGQIEINNKDRVVSLIDRGKKNREDVTSSVGGDSELGGVVGSG